MKGMEKLKKIFVIFISALLVLILAACNQAKIEIKEPEKSVAEVSASGEKAENELLDDIEKICDIAFEKWKELGYMEDFGDEPITQEFIRKVYSNYLLFIDKVYDFFDRFVSAKELDSFSENYFDVPFLSLEAVITPDYIDKERGIKIDTHPQLYPGDTIYSFRSTGKDGDNYYFEVKIECDYEELIGLRSEKVVRVNFRYDDSKIYFTKQSSVCFDDILSDFGDGMLLMSYPWNDTKDIPVDGLVMWYGYRLLAQNRVTDYMKDGKDGLFIPEDEFESVIYDYFGLLPEHLRTSDTYNESEKSYITPMALYDLAKTEYKVTKAGVDNDTMKIYFSLTVGDNEPEDRVLTVDISNEKIRFISYL